MNLLKIFLVVLAATAFIVSCGQPAAGPNAKNTSAPANVNSNNATANAPTQPGGTVDDVAMSTELYTKNCMICHKDSGKGGKVTIDGKTIEPFDLTSAKMQAKTDDKLLSQIKDGSPEDGMPAFKGKLTDDQIKSIIRHVRSL